MKTNLRIGSRLLTLAVAACPLLLPPAIASGEEATLSATLQGPEVSGDPDGQGEATLTLDPRTNEVVVRVSYSNIAEPTAMHVRWGATGLQGNVVVPLVIESDDGGTLVGRRRSAKPDIVETILASPEEYYLVIINREHPIGALRGQLSE